MKHLSRVWHPSLASRLGWVAAALAVVASAAGVLVANLYSDAPYWVQQARGTDLATLFLAAPVLLVGLWTAGRGSQAGRAAVVGALLYLVYNYAIFAFSVEMNRLSGLYIAILGLAVWALGLTLVGAAPESTMGDVAERLPRRLAAGALLAITGIFGMLWVAQLAQSTASGALPPDVARAGIPTNPVYALDLGIFLPLCAVAAVGLLRRRASASAFAFPMLLWLAFTSAGIVGAFWLTAEAGEAVPFPVVVLVTAIGLVTALIAALGAFNGDTRQTHSEEALAGMGTN